MAVNVGRYGDAVNQYNLAKQLADKMQSEQDEESKWGSFLSIAAPIAASVLLPGIGTAAMGLLGGGALGGLGTAAAGAISGGTLTGGLLAGLGKAAGTYAISEGIDTLGRESFGAGADIEDISLSGAGWRQKKAIKEAKGDIQGLIDASDEGQISSALLSGALQGFDTMGGIDAIKAKSSELGKKLSGKWGKAYEGTTEGLGMEKALTKDIIPKAKAPMQIPEPKFKTPLASEGGSPINFLTGEEPQANLLGGIQENLLDKAPSYQGESLLDSLTEFPQIFTDYIENNPGVTQEQLDEMIASWRGQ